jgi:hypothetical protein
VRVRAGQTNTSQGSQGSDVRVGIFGSRYAPAASERTKGLE